MKVLSSGQGKVFRTLGSSAHTDSLREVDDYYATDPVAAEFLCEIEYSVLHFSKTVWECACGEGHLSRVFEKEGLNVVSTDLVDRNYGVTGVDFFSTTKEFVEENKIDVIVTNPPFSKALEFVKHAHSIIPVYGYVMMFLRLQFMEGQKRREFFDMYPPVRIWVSSKRITCAKNADFEYMRKNGGSAMCFAWFVWNKLSEEAYQTDTELKWFN
jgi:hypothetical protein